MPKSPEAISDVQKKYDTKEIEKVPKSPHTDTTQQNVLNNFKEQMLNFFNEVIKPTFKNFLAFISSVILIITYIVDIMGIKIPFFDVYRIWVIGGTISLIGIIFVYYLMKSNFKRAEERFRIRFELHQLQLEKHIDALRSLEKPKAPAIDVEKLTYHDIGFAIYCLTKKIIGSNFLVYADPQKTVIDTEKNIIFGIDRGGAIVGGLLGKSLRLAEDNLAIYWANTDIGKKTSLLSPKCLEDLNFPTVRKIILVDDAVRRGSTMAKAIEILEEKKKDNTFEYIKVCILNYPYSNRTRATNPDFFVYKTQNIDLDLPWDVHWDTMPKNEEYDDYCFKYAS